MTQARETILATQEERNLGAAVHMAPFIGGLIPGFGSFLVTVLVWWWKRESAFVAAHARASINFQLTMVVYYTLAFGYVFVSVAFGMTLLASSTIFETVQIVRAARRARAGEYCRYYMCLEFVKEVRRG